jgi:hypothetical protein
MKGRHNRSWHSCNVLTAHTIDFGAMQNTVGRKTSSLATYEKVDSTDCKTNIFFSLPAQHLGRVSSVGIATCYGLDGPGIETR